MPKQPWLLHAQKELWFICLPPFLCLLLIFLFPSFFQSSQELSTAWWVVLILVIDVGHVYSTLYRTYLDKQQWLLHKPKLILIPILCLLIACLLFQLGDHLFWRIMAYTAVFHFIRQQYGLVKVYLRHETSKSFSRITTYAVYGSMLYPLIYWHCYGPFQFNWFTSDDFIFWKNPMLEQVAGLVYFLLLLVYLVFVIQRYIRTKEFNVPVFLVLSGTALNWYFGIVYFKSDLSFTLLNVISHGIPYIALVWLLGEKQSKDTARAQYRFQSYFFRRYGLFLFLFIPLFLGFVEEGFWDAWVWNEHAEVFSWFYAFQGSNLKYLVVPILITPQLTHYVLDGFIWKLSKGHLQVK